jgi:hypothetical protein
MKSSMTGVLLFVLMMFIGVGFAAAQTATINVTVGTPPAGSPPNSTYDFECIPDFNATNFTWSFGDGVIVPGFPDFVRHTYVDSGTFPVTCIAFGEGGVNATAQTSVTVIIPNETTNVTNQTNVTPTLSLSIAPGFPQGMNFSFICSPSGFTPSGFDWNFGDGQSLSNISNSTVFHDFTAPGNFTVMCTASGTNISATLPVEVVAQNVTPPPQNQTNQSNQTNVTIPACSVTNLTATCTGGNITSDTDGTLSSDNCRHITCQKDGDTLEAKACDIVNGTTATGFQLFKQSNASTNLQLCLDSACIGPNNGFAQGNFNSQTCISPPPTNQTGNQTNQTGNQTQNQTTGNVSAFITIAPFYPQFSTFVFICNVNGFTPTSFSWNYGDGNKLLNVANSNTFHT